MVSVGRVERPLNALSTRSLCRLGYTDMEDQGGFEPPMGLRHGIKSPVRSAATGTGPWIDFGGKCFCVGASRWSRTTCHSVIGRGPRRSDWLAFDGASSSTREFGAPWRIRTPECLGVGQVPWAAWRRELGAPGRNRTSTERYLKPPPLPLGYRRVPVAGFEPALSGV